MSKDIEALIERLEKATGPDREIDCRLAHHFDRKGIYYGTGDDSGWAPAATVDGWDDAKWASMRTEHVSSTVPHYTASIDAALALCERMLPGWDWIIGHTNGGLTIHCQLGSNKPEDLAFGETAPLAILLALLRSLNQEESRSEESKNG